MMGVPMRPAPITPTVLTAVFVNSPLLRKTGDRHVFESAEGEKPRKRGLSRFSAFLVMVSSSAASRPLPWRSRA